MEVQVKWTIMRLWCTAAFIIGCMLVQVMSRDCDMCIVTVTNLENRKGMELFKKTLLGYAIGFNSNKENCKINYKFNELLTNTNSSVLSAANTVEKMVKNSTRCILLHASDWNTSKLIVNYAIMSSIPIISTIQEERPQVVTGISSFNDVVRISSYAKIDSKTFLLPRLLQTLKWQKFVVIMDNNFDVMRIPGFIQDFLSRENVVTIRQLILQEHSSTHYVTQKLSALSTSYSRYLVLQNNVQVIRRTFRAAHSLGMSQGTFKWVLQTDVSLESLKGENLPQGLFAVVPTLLPLSHEKFLLDAARVVHNAVKTWTTEHCMNENETACTAKLSSYNNIFRYLLGTAIPGATGFIQFDNQGYRKNAQYDIDVLSVSDPSNSRWDKVAQWNGQGINVHKQTFAPLRLRVVVNVYPPNVMTLVPRQDDPCPEPSLPCSNFTKGPNGKAIRKRQCCFGYAIDVLKLLQTDVGFTSDIRFGVDGQYGVFNKTSGKWNGIVSELLQNKADLSPDLYVSALRAKVVDFTEPYLASGISLMVKEKKRNAAQIYWLSYLRPFTPRVWGILLGCFAVMLVFLWFVDKLYLMTKTAIGKRKRRNKFSLDNSVAFTLALAFGRPTDGSTPSSNGARMAALAFGVAMLVFFSTYSANLAAFLIIDDMYTEVNSIYDSKIQSPPAGFRYGTIRGTNMDDFFQNSEKVLFKNMWYHMRHNNVKSMTEGIEKLQTGELSVLIADQANLEYEALRDPYCGLKVVGAPIGMSGASITVRKGSPWFTPIADALSKARAKGLTDYIHDFWFGNRICQREVPPERLSFQDLSGLFLQLTIAIVACSLGSILHIFIRNSTFCNDKRRLELTQDNPTTFEEVTILDRETTL